MTNPVLYHPILVRLVGDRSLKTLAMSQKSLVMENLVQRKVLSTQMPLIGSILQAWDRVSCRMSFSITPSNPNPDSVPPRRAL